MTFFEVLDEVRENDVYQEYIIKKYTSFLFLGYLLNTLTSLSSYPFYIGTVCSRNTDPFTGFYKQRNHYFGSGFHLCRF